MHETNQNPEQTQAEPTLNVGQVYSATLVLLQEIDTLEANLDEYTNLLEEHGVLKLNPYGNNEQKTQTQD